MRVTVDLDDATTLDVITAWHRLAELGDGGVRGRVSSGGEGVHLRVHGCRRDDDVVRRLRRHCGDDPRRVDLDADPTEPSPGQVFWSTKHGGSAGEWRQSLDHLLADYRSSASAEVRFDPPPRLQPRG